RTAAACAVANHWHAATAAGARGRRLRGLYCTRCLLVRPPLDAVATYAHLTQRLLGHRKRR
ncbi:hypothetical protein BHM03_00022089, partial [Ensete ventricosum]